MISSRSKALSVFAGNHDSAYFDPSASTTIRVFCRFFLHSEHRKGRPTWTRRMHRHVRKTGKRSVGETTEWVKKRKEKIRRGSASHGSTSNVILTSPAVNWLGRTSIVAAISLVFEQVIYSELHCKSLLLHCLPNTAWCPFMHQHAGVGKSLRNVVTACHFRERFHWLTWKQWLFIR